MVVPFFISYRDIVILSFVSMHFYANKTLEMNYDDDESILLMNFRCDISECKSEAEPGDNHRPHWAQHGAEEGEEHREACRAMAICSLRHGLISLCHRSLRQEGSHRLRSQGASGDGQPQCPRWEVHMALQRRQPKCLLHYVNASMQWFMIKLVEQFLNCPASLTILKQDFWTAMFNGFGRNWKWNILLGVKEDGVRNYWCVIVYDCW